LVFLDCLGGGGVREGRMATVQVPFAYPVAVGQEPSQMVDSTSTQLPRANSASQGLGVP
jgi:hypothetical protein